MTLLLHGYATEITDISSPLFPQPQREEVIFLISGQLFGLAPRREAGTRRFAMHSRLERGGALVLSAACLISGLGA
jgi:hypothetical protein